MDLCGEVGYIFQAAFCPLDVRHVGHLELTAGDQLRLKDLHDELRYKPLFDSQFIWSDSDEVDFIKVMMECKDLAFKEVQKDPPDFRMCSCEITSRPGQDTASPLQFVFEKATVQEGKRLCFHWWPFEKCTMATKKTVVDVHLYKGCHGDNTDEETLKLVDHKSCPFEINCSCEPMTRDNIVCHGKKQNSPPAFPEDSVVESLVFNGRRYCSSRLLS